jgi:hypothetical protein
MNLDPGYGIPRWFDSRSKEKHPIGVRTGFIGAANEHFSSWLFLKIKNHYRRRQSLIKFIRSSISLRAVSDKLTRHGCCPLDVSWMLWRVLLSAAFLFPSRRLPAVLSSCSDDRLTYADGLFDAMRFGIAFMFTVITIGVVQYFERRS